MNLKGRKGITLVALVITIVVLLILAGITIGILFSDNGIIEKSRQAKFETNIKALEESIYMYELNNYGQANIKYESIIPNLGKLTNNERESIVEENATLEEAVFETTGETVFDRNLYWLDSNKLLSENLNSKYIIDMDTLQVYQYNGEYFAQKTWHTIGKKVQMVEIKTPVVAQQVSDVASQVNITISYDENATIKQYSINGEDLQDYTGTFTAENNDIIYAINENENGNKADVTYTVDL